MKVLGHTLGFPRIGLYRELKYALEQYWNGTINQDKLLDIGCMLRMRHWKQQIDAGIDLISVGDFSWYDHVLTMSMMVYNIPTRYQSLLFKKNALDVLFDISRGCHIDGIAIVPSEMKKWFNTNYHYIVPEFVQNQKFKLYWTQLFSEIDEASILNYPIKPILLGPLTYLWLGKVKGIEFDRLSLLPSLLLVYQEILGILSEKNISWVQIDEPILALELPKSWIEAYLKTYRKTGPLNHKKIKILLATYFDGIFHQLDVISQFSIDGIHIDLTSSFKNAVSTINKKLPQSWVLSAGIINGRNIWKTDLYHWFCQLFPILESRDLWIGSSCSLLHSPIDLNIEMGLSSDIKNQFAFALQKCVEIKMICDALNSNSTHDNMIYNKNILKQYYIKNDKYFYDKIVCNIDVQKRCKSFSGSVLFSRTGYVERSRLQRKKFNLPLYPTTTIGSFPQTQDIRRLRLKFKNGQICKSFYDDEIKKYIKKIIIEQEKLGLDVLVHGEPERNDMVEYFGENLTGFVFTQSGWVQSYGSRCVKPPIIVGDISRPKFITGKWIIYAQSLTNKPVKGILTGPVTIMTWSFIREDIDRSAIALQLALAIKDEVMDLERFGVGIIQIDEPALREGLPLKKSEQKQYLEWAVNAFKITVSEVQDSTQIHTHMCYSEFDEIIYDILKLDVDVLTVEASRSDLKLLSFFRNYQDNLNEIGPGIYDIHSINEPSVSNMVEKLNRFLEFIPKNRLWINPDCGLKTRSWTEIKLALGNMVAAAKMVRSNSYE